MKLDSNAPDGFVVHSFAGDDPLTCRDHVREKAGLAPFKPNGGGRQRASHDQIERALVAVVAGQRRDGNKRIVAKYDYTDAAGALLYQVLRLEPKSFRQRRPDGNGGWTWELDERRVLYPITKCSHTFASAVGRCFHPRHSTSMPEHDTQILTNAYGRPWTSDGFRASWGKTCIKAGLASDLHFHDLRGSAVVRLALAEATVPQIATFTGHSLKDVEAILDKHYLGRDIALAEDAVRKLERKEKRTKSVKGR